MNYISASKTKVIEGELRGAELANYLENLNAPRKVWLSEDGTGIVSKIEYDPGSNQLIGLVLPLNGSTGMPIPFTFMARSADEINCHVNKDKSSLVYFVMAQPLKQGTPPFLLLMFGTNNKFNAISVLQRWKFLKDELKKSNYMYSMFLLTTTNFFSCRFFYAYQNILNF